MNDFKFESAAATANTIHGKHITHEGIFCEEFEFDISQLKILNTDEPGIKSAPLNRSVDYMYQLLCFIADDKYPEDLLKYFKRRINTKDDRYYDIIKTSLSNILYEDRRGRVTTPKIKVVNINCIYKTIGIYR